MFFFFTDFYLLSIYDHIHVSFERYVTYVTETISLNNL
jgi:hypothetical protein